MTQLKRAKMNNASQANYRQRQRGMGAVGMLAIAGLAIFFALVGFKTVSYTHLTLPTILLV